MANGYHIMTLDVEKDEVFEKKRLRCGCVPTHCGCLFCDPEMILQSAPKENRKKIQEQCEQGRKLLKNGVPINKVMELIFEGYWKEKTVEAEK